MTVMQTVEHELEVLCGPEASISCDELDPQARVADFVDRLALLPLSEWQAIGAELARTPHPHRDVASAILGATLQCWELGVPAWFARDAVDTATFLAAASERVTTPEVRSAFATARAAAHEAALALVALPYLSAADAEALYAPFARTMTV